MTDRRLLLTYDATPTQRTVVEQALPDTIEGTYLSDIESNRRSEAVGEADVILAWDPSSELDEESFEALGPDQIVQSLSAGVDHVPFDRIPDGVTVLSNAGAYAAPMAEHIVAMYLSLAKRLPIEHRKLQAGEFDQFRPTRWVAGSTCGIVGYGAIGEAAGRLLKRLDVSIMAINRSGEADEPADFLGTPDDLEDVLRRCDGLVLAAPLTPETRGLIDREKLSWMAADAMLINVARGELVDQGDLYAHLEANPDFQAGLEAWWTEPVRHGEFDLDYPLLDLPNVLGCPHNSAQVPGIREEGLRHALRNLVTALEDGRLKNTVDRELGY